MSLTTGIEFLKRKKEVQLREEIGRSEEAKADDVTCELSKPSEDGIIDLASNLNAQEIGVDILP